MKSIIYLKGLLTKKRDIFDDEVESMRELFQKAEKIIDSIRYSTVYFCLDMINDTVSPETYRDLLNYNLSELVDSLKEIDTDESNKLLKEYDK